MRSMIDFVFLRLDYCCEVAKGIDVGKFVFNSHVEAFFQISGHFNQLQRVQAAKDDFVIKIMLEPGPLFGKLENLFRVVAHCSIAPEPRLKTTNLLKQ